MAHPPWSRGFRVKVNSSTYNWIGVVWVPVTTLPSDPVNCNLPNVIAPSHNLALNCAEYLVFTLLTVGLGVSRLCSTIIIVPSVHLINDLGLDTIALFINLPESIQKRQGQLI